MTATEKDEGPGPIEIQSAFSHPDFDRHLDTPQINTPHFGPGEDILVVAPSAVVSPPADTSVTHHTTKRAESATTPPKGK